MEFGWRGYFCWNHRISVMLRYVTLHYVTIYSIYCVYIRCTSTGNSGSVRIWQCSTGTVDRNFWILWNRASSLLKLNSLAMHLSFSVTHTYYILRLPTVLLFHSGVWCFLFSFLFHILYSGCHIFQMNMYFLKHYISQLLY